VIALFDREVVKTGKMEVRFSRILHRLFELRQRADYKELIEIAPEDAMLAVKNSREFLTAARAAAEAKEV
jgi:uncharacterized protein (UPF0332 family)